MINYHHMTKSFSFLRKRFVTPEKCHYSICQSLVQALSLGDHSLTLMVTLIVLAIGNISCLSAFDVLEGLNCVKGFWLMSNKALVFYLKM